MAHAPFRRLGLVAAALLVAGLGRSAAQQPLPAQPPVTPPAADPSKPVAFIYGDIPVTQAAFGQYLMDRGGAEKLELFVNKIIIETAARKAGVTVTKTEMEAALQEDIKGISTGGPVTRQDFVKVVLAKHGKTLFEWMEDVIRPRLLLRKMCYDRVKVSDEDLKKQFERRYGEQRAVQIILYPLGDDRSFIDKQYAKYRNDPVEFDSAARAQANPSLAAALGKIKPITRHLVAEDKIVEKTAFNLKVNEVSEVIRTQQGWLVMKLLAVIPPNKEANFEREKPLLQKAAYDEALERTIPEYFAELRKAAGVRIEYKPPAEWQSISAATTVPSVIPSGNAGVQPAGAQQPQTGGR